MNKGLEMSMVNLVILIIALAVITLVLMKLIPAFGNLITASMGGIKASFCKLMGIAGWLFGC